MRTWARFRRRRSSLLGLALALTLALTALAADFIASSRPILLRRGGRLYLFANVVEYRDLRGFDASWLGPGDWALWPACRHGPYEIPSLESVSGSFPQPPGAGH